eukprot:Rhum_TRINITY_DN4907_c0_g1::Rhum_TRINITY_DN4907_c0_g1_i1::g.16029::m.16029
MFDLRDVSGSCEGGARTATATVAVCPDDDVFERRCGRDIVVVVPGNPGVAAFYTDFMTHLMKDVEGKRVVCLGYAGHSSGRRDGVFSLQEQVDFVASLVDMIRGVNEDKVRLHIIGHSVGAYIGLRVAERLPEQVVASFAGLFPAVEDIGKGSNAVISPVFQPVLRHAAAGLVGLLSWLPESVRLAVARRFVQESKDPKHVDIVAAIDYSMLHNILYMSKFEMHEIGTMNRKTLSAVAHNATFYYAEVDGWVPPHVVPRMRENLSSLSQKTVGSTPQCAAPRVIIDESGAPHAFVLSHSEHVAQLIAPTLL